MFSFVFHDASPSKRKTEKRRLATARRDRRTPNAGGARKHCSPLGRLGASPFPLRTGYGVSAGAKHRKFFCRRQCRGRVFPRGTRGSESAEGRQQPHGFYIK